MELIDESELTAEIISSPVKKHQLQEQRRQRKLKLRANLPVLTAKEIRRYRLHFKDAILVDLEEAGNENSAEFIRQLIEYQEDTRQKVGPGSSIWLKPLLGNSKPELETLAKGLSKAEQAHLQEDFTAEWDEILRLAAFYAFGPEDWWWLGEQLLYQCTSMEYLGSEFQKQLAQSHYVFGKYFLEYFIKVDTARTHLEVSREISIGKSWSCKKIHALLKDQETIFIESCSLLYKALMEEARAIYRSEPKKASEICTLARKRAAEACNQSGEFEAWLLKGRCEVLIHNESDAIAVFIKALHCAVRQKSTKMICEALIRLSMAYLKHGKHRDALNTLKKLKQVAQDSNMPFYVGQAYRFMAEYHLNTKHPSLATPLLLLAFFIFHQHHHLPQREEVRTLAAISAGNELFPTYIEILKGCDDSEEGHANLLTLLKWNDHREIFWKQHTSSFSFHHEDELVEGRLMEIEKELLMLGEEEIEIACTKYDETFLLSFIENNQKNNVSN